MAAHFERLLEGICADPDTHLSALPMLSERERHQILVDWNKTSAPYPRDRAVTQVFEAQADRSPGAVAIVSGAERITYAGLNGLSNQLARFLRRQGIRRGERVALCLERSIEMVAAVLGVLKAGAAYVPLDPGDPPERLRLMIEDAGVAALIAHRNTASRLPAVDDARVFVLDGERENLARESAANLEDHPAAEDMAYVMYTSGSTGAPKAVTIAHRGIVRLVSGVSYVSLTPDDVVLQAAPLSFDASTFEIWGALLNGGTLSQVPIEKPSLAELGDVLEGNRVTVAWFTSGLFSQMVEHELDRLCTVRQVLAGGDVLSVPHVRRFLSAAAGSTLINGYGPTENTTFTCCQRLAADERIEITVPIGRPISNTEVFVLDRHLNPQPVGVPGELYAGGDGIALGYWNRPELTAERFLPHPFRSDPASRVYRTGDRVRYRDDGTIEFLGRFDHQLKVRGYRVELGEVEAVLAQHPAVSEAVVVAGQDADGTKRLDAYVAARAAVSGPELRQDLRSRLPEYMLPSTITVLDALPKSASGKVDRRVLPTLQTRSSDAQLGTPRDGMEEELARLWCEVLKVKAVGIDDNFFDLGGHSLLSTTLIARIRKQYGVELPLRALFDAPTIAALATRLKTGADKRDERLIPLQPRGSKTPLFCVHASFGQRRLWFLDQWEPGSGVYNVPVATRLTGPLDLDVLERSLGAVVARHESLRTRFALHDGQPMQVVESAVEVPVRRLDFTDLPPDQREAEGRRAIAEEAGRLFNLSEAPLIRALVVRLSSDDHIVLVTLHHIVCDGWSIDVLLGELGSCYNAFVAGHPSPLAPVEIQYGDYSVWQRGWLEGAELERQLAYWRQQLAGVPVLQVHPDRVRPTVVTSRGAEHPIALPRGLTDRLIALGRNQRATLFMTLLAAFQTLLMRYTGQEDLAVGSPIAGRNRVEIEPLIGFFVNTLVLRTDLGGNPTFRELLGRVRAVTLDAYSHQDIPFEKLVEELRPERATEHAPLCQAMFVLHGAQTTPGFQGTTAAAYAVNRSTSKFEVTLSLRDGPGGLRGVLEYNTDLFEPATIARMAEHFERLVEGAVTMPDARLSELPLLGESERSRILVEWNHTPAQYPARRLHQLVEDQAARTPHATAVVSGNDSLSYTTLNARANQLARALRRSGIGPDVVVGVCLERSSDLAVALLAVLKAGGAYLPLDPSYPAPRLQAMVEDARAALIVSDSALVERVADTTSAVLCVDRDRAAWTSEAGDNLENAAADESLAYVLFTSGSTGRPKGVMVPHRAVCNYVGWMTSAFGFAPDDRVLLRTPMSFDLSVWEFFVPLTSGSTLVMAPPGNEFDPAAVASLIAEHGITVMQLVPSLLALLLDAPDLSRCQTLRRLFSGGAALTPALRDRFFDRFAHTALHNGYGPTETCINSVMWDCERGRARSVVPIGRPIANTSVYVLGPRLEVQPIGVPGELYIGGAGVARGYINQPKLTAERFIPNPFAAGGEERLYRTGDRVRYLADGNLEFLGRNDDQVKIRGVRIELQEVGATLARHSGVQQSIVLARSDDSGDPLLVAYYVPREPSPDESELRTFLRQTLPEAMVPTWFVKLDALPVGPSGKVDPRSLPAPAVNRAAQAERFVAPRTSLERSIAQIWREVLKVETVGVHDNFFELGGHSLLAVQIVTRVRAVSGIELPLRILFEAPTIAGLATRVVSPEPAPFDCLVALQPTGTKTPFFCIHGVGGEIHVYAELARLLDPERPFFGLRAPRSADGRTVATVEALAARHVSDVRRVAPTGPYLLGGYSSGSMVAYEMAQQLTASGEQVLLVAALDAGPPNLRLPRSSVLAWLGAAKNLAWFVVDDLMEANRREIGARLRSKMTLLAGKLANVPGLGWMRPERQTDVRDALGIPWVPQEYADLIEQHYWSYRAYQPRPYPGRVALFKARTRPLLRLSEPDLGWSGTARGGVQVHTVPGSHSNMLRQPHVKHLADAMRKAFDDAERAGERALLVVSGRTEG